MIRMPLIYIPEGSTVLLNSSEYAILYKGKTGATLSSGSLTSLPILYRKFSTKALGRPDEPNPFIYCDLIKAPNGFSVEEFISLHPEYFI